TTRRWGSASLIIAIIQKCGGDGEAARLTPPAPVEAAAVVGAGDDIEQYLAEAFDRAATGLAIGGGDPGALRRRQRALESATLVGQLQQTLPPVLRAAVLDDKPLAHQLPQYPVEALLRDFEDGQELADRHLRPSPDKMHHAM